MGSLTEETIDICLSIRAPFDTGGGNEEEIRIVDCIKSEQGIRATLKSASTGGLLEVKAASMKDMRAQLYDSLQAGYVPANSKLPPISWYANA